MSAFSPTLTALSLNNYTKGEGILFLVYLFVSLVSTHLADGIFQHDILVEEVVDSLLTFRVVVHRALEEETQEALDAVTAGAGSEVTEQCEVEEQRCSQDRVAAEEVDLDLHGIARIESRQRKLILICMG